LKEPSKLFDIFATNNVAITEIIKLTNAVWGMELAIDDEIPFYKIKYCEKVKLFKLYIL
jgi:hypothetical protein